MINEIRINFQPKKDPDERMVEKFKEFIDENDFTSDQMKKAIHKFYEISDNEDKDPAVEKILKKMNEMVNNNFSLNKFSELFKAKKEYENAVPNYYKFIDDLDVSEKEKRVMKSIVEKKRKGEVEFVVDNLVVARFKLEDENIPDGVLADKLEAAIRKNIKRIPSGKKFGFNFSEE